MCEQCKKAEAKITIEVKGHEVKMQIDGNNAGIIRAFASIFGSAKHDVRLATLISLAVDNAESAHVVKSEFQEETKP